MYAAVDEDAKTTLLMEDFREAISKMSLAACETQGITALGSLLNERSVAYVSGSAWNRSTND